MVTRVPALRRRGVVLAELLVAAVVMGVSLAVLVGMAGSAINSQAQGERLGIAAMLADEQLNLVLMRGPDDYERRFEVSGQCDAPFEAYRYETSVGGGTGEAYEVIATIYYWEGGREKSVAVSTLMAPRLGDEPDPDRKPKETVDREQ